MRKERLRSEGEFLFRGWEGSGQDLYPIGSLARLHPGLVELQGGKWKTPLLDENGTYDEDSVWICEADHVVVMDRLRTGPVRVLVKVLLSSGVTGYLKDNYLEIVS